MDRKDGLEEGSALAAVFFFDVDAHESEFEHVFEEVFAEFGFFIHGANVRGEAFTREAAHGVLEELFIGGELSERGGDGFVKGGGLHGSIIYLLGRQMVWESSYEYAGKPQQSQTTG